mmetsp:Transcript_10328/g.17957  ORF Transcript_10328/g.17957 Transcript_10328/m.17957 type:complete len:216 (-) Transcript_10328:347-994(-)
MLEQLNKCKDIHCQQVHIPNKNERRKHSVSVRYPRAGLEFECHTTSSKPEFDQGKTHKHCARLHSRDFLRPLCSVNGPWSCSAASPSQVAQAQAGLKGLETCYCDQVRKPGEARPHKAAGERRGESVPTEPEEGEGAISTPSLLTNIRSADSLKCSQELVAHKVQTMQEHHVDGLITCGLGPHKGRGWVACNRLTCRGPPLLRPKVNYLLLVRLC